MAVRRSLAALVIATAACTGSAPSASPGASAVGSASPAAGIGAPAERTIFVATDGDDTAPGSSARPLRTLAAAQAAVRAALSQDTHQSVRVSIAGGRYFLATPLYFDGRDAPADGFTVTYAGPADAGAVVVGGRVITGWEAVPGGVFRARLTPPTTTFGTLFENGERAVEARYPASGYLQVAREVGAGGSKVQFGYAAGDMPDTVGPGASVYVWAGSWGVAPALRNQDWQVDVLPITAIDRAARTITLGREAKYPIRPPNRWFIQGPRSLLDQPGQFALDASQGYVYYRPRSLPIERQEIVAPTVPKIIGVLGRSADTPLRGLVFERLTLSVSDAPRVMQANCPACGYAAVYLENVDGVVIRSSKIQGAGGSGVEISRYSQRVVIEKDLIEGVGVDGIFLHGSSAESREHRANTVSGNLIRGVGQLSGSGKGIYAVASGENRIEHNKVADAPNSGIFVVGGFAAYDFLRRYPDQVGPTPGDAWLSFAARENVVRYNDVSRVLTDSSDGGGIDVGGSILTTVEGNRVHDMTSGTGGFTEGIYLDVDASWCVVRGNLVYGVAGTDRDGVSAGIMAKGVYNEVTNNVVATAGPGAQLYSFKDGVRHDHLTVTRNIFFAEGGADVYRFGDWSDDRVSEARSNVVFHPGGRYTVRFGFGTERLTLDQWREKYGLDRDSVIADPLFVDPAHGDYRVRDGSPALALGFTNIDASPIGLPADFPFR